MTSIADEIERARLIAGLEQPMVAGAEPATEKAHVAPRLPPAFIEYLRQAGYKAAQVDALVVRVIGVSCAFLILLFVHPITALGWLLYLTFECNQVSKARASRAESFDKDYPALLLGLAASAKAGRDPIQALTDARALFPEESTMREILERFFEDTESGKTAEDCLIRFGSDVSAEDVHLFRTAMVLHIHEGSSVAQALQRLTRVTRQRQSFRRKIRASIAVQRLSSVGIFVAFLCIALLQVISNAQAIQTAYQHPMGFKLLVAGICLLIFGMLWMRRIMSTRVG